MSKIVHSVQPNLSASFPELSCIKIMYGNLVKPHVLFAALSTKGVWIGGKNVVLGYMMIPAYNYELINVWTCFQINIFYLTENLLSTI